MNLQHFIGTNRPSNPSTSTRWFGFSRSNDNLSTELESEHRINSTGTATLFGVYVATNDTTATSTFRYRKNEANGNGVISVGSGATGQFEDVSGSDAVVDNDQVNYQLLVGSGGTGLTFSTGWHTWAPVSGTVAYIGSSLTTALSGTADQFISFSRPPGGETTEANAQNVIGAIATLQGAMAYVLTGSRDDTTLFRIRINGANGNNLLSYAPLASGTVEDTSSSDAVAVADKVGWIWDQAAGTGTLDHRVLKIEVSASSLFPAVCGAGSSGQTINAATTQFGGAHDRLAVTTTETSAQDKANASYSWTQLYGYVSAFSLDAGALTIRAKVNGANGNNTIAFTGTGQLGDTSSTDSLVDEDEFGFSYITGGTTGSVTARAVSSILSQPASGTNLSANLSEPVVGSSVF